MTVLSLILETYEWDTLKDYAKKYENDRDSGTRSLISGINRNYFEPYVMELVFEFTVNANTMIERQIRRMGSIQDDVEEALRRWLYCNIANWRFCIASSFKRCSQQSCYGKGCFTGTGSMAF